VGRYALCVPKTFTWILRRIFIASPDHFYMFSAILIFGGIAFFDKKRCDEFRHRF
jgi:hypothetical protein